MAFFTRPSISVPILPPSEMIACSVTKISSNSSQVSQDSTNVASTSSSTSCIVADGTTTSVSVTTTNENLATSTSSLSSTESAESQRYEYTIETFGVQVWYLSRTNTRKTWIPISDRRAIEYNGEKSKARPRRNMCPCGEFESVVPMMMMMVNRSTWTGQCWCDDVKSVLEVTSKNLFLKFYQRLFAYKKRL